MVLRAVYISERQDRNWIIIQIVCILSQMNWSTAERGVSDGLHMCIATMMYDCCFVVHTIYITQLFVYDFSILPRLESIQHVPLRFRTTLQMLLFTSSFSSETFKTPMQYDSKQISLFINVLLVALNTHKSIAYIATPLRQSSLRSSYILLHKHSIVQVVVHNILVRLSCCSLR